MWMLARDRKNPEEAVVSDRSDAWAAMRERNELAEHLLGGTEAMRRAGQLYLPQYPEEENEDYQIRLERTVLTNFFRKSVRTLSAKPFMKHMEIKDLAPVLDPLRTDADKEGNSLHIFSHRAFRTGMAKGLSHIVIDYPRNASPDGTLAGQRASGTRPYFKHIGPENVIAAYSEIINGDERYTHVRILMNSVERVGFGEILIQRILVMEPGMNTLYRLVDEAHEEWRVEDRWATNLDFVPMVSFYAERTAFMEAEPPLSDLANLNVAHWQSSSDQMNILTVSRFPMLAASGITMVNDSDHANPGRHRIGPRQIYTASDPASRFYWLEPTGAAIESGEKDLERLKDEMSLLGMELVMRGRSGRITATAHHIDKAEADTALAQMAIDFEETINRALRYANAYTNGGDLEEDAGSVKLASDFGLTLRDSQEIAYLIDMRAQGFLSQKQLLTELKRRSVLDDDLDIVIEMQKLDSMTPEDGGGGDSPTPTDVPLVAVQ